LNQFQTYNPVYLCYFLKEDLLLVSTILKTIFFLVYSLKLIKAALYYTGLDSTGLTSSAGLVSSVLASLALTSLDSLFSSFLVSLGALAALTSSGLA
jgi:hypothetical protein